MRVLAQTCLALACALTACGDKPSIDLTMQTGSDPIGSAADASSRVAACDQAMDGTPCGLDMHCVFNVCSENVCGDGVKYGGEACDDGNDRDNDGCDSRCKMEIPPGCGNGKLEPGEQCDDAEATATGRCTILCRLPKCGDEIVSPGEACDDGNTSDGDRCSSRCQLIPPRCGNGDKDSSEACDDGNNADGDGCQSDCTFPKDAAGSPADAGPASMDAGMTKPDAGSHDAGHIKDAGTTKDAGTGQVDAGTKDAGSADAGPAPPLGSAQVLPACKACRELNCAEYQGQLPVLSLCFENEDPAFNQQCIDLLECAYQHDCGYKVTGTAECFCGTFTIADCPGVDKQNGPCIDEVYAAARTRDLNTIIPLFGDVSLPLGVVTYFQECDTTLCPVCLP